MVLYIRCNTKFHLLRYTNIVVYAEQERMRQEQYLLKQEELRKEREKALESEQERQKQIAEMRLANSYNEVKDKFTQQEFQIRDSSGGRWIQCELCGEIKPESEFGSYGGTNHVNLGVCYKCSRRDK